VKNSKYLLDAIHLAPAKQAKEPDGIPSGIFLYYFGFLVMFGGLLVSPLFWAGLAMTLVGYLCRCIHGCVRDLEIEIIARLDPAAKKEDAPKAR